MTKITELPVAGAVTGDELLELVQGKTEVERDPDQEECAKKNREPEEELAQEITINQTH